MALLTAWFELTGLDPLQDSNGRTVKSQGLAHGM